MKYKQPNILEVSKIFENIIDNTKSFEGSDRGCLLSKDNKILERNAQSAKNLRGVQNVQRPADKRYLLEETANFNKMMKELKQVPDIPMAKAKKIKNPNNSLLRRLLPLSLLGTSGDSE